MKYYILSNLTRIFLQKLRKHHSNDEQLLVFSKDFIGEEIFSYGVYERDEICSIINALDFDSSLYNIVDIGANIGNHTVQFSKHFKTVYSFEPNPVVFEVLKLNTRVKENVELFNFGLSNETGTFHLAVPDGNFGGGNVTLNSSPTNFQIFLKRFDDFFEGNFAVVKIDVEGHEVPALKGMAGSIAKDKPIICIELINTPEKGKELLGLLRSYGYTNYYIPHLPSFFFNKNSKSHFWKLFNGLFLKQKHQLQKIEKFDKSFYNLVVCEHVDSSYRLKNQ